MPLLDWEKWQRGNLLARKIRKAHEAGTTILSIVIHLVRVLFYPECVLHPVVIMAVLIYSPLNRFYSEQTETLRNKTFDPHRYYKNDSVSYRNYSDFKRLSYIRSLLSLATPSAVFQQSIEELKWVKNEFAKNEMTKISYGFLKKQVMDLLLAGKKYDALSFYSEQSKKLPRTTSDMDLNYLIFLAQAASEFGLGKWSGDLFKEYSKKTKNWRASDQQDENKDAQMDKSETAYIQAIGMWLKDRPGSQKTASLTTETDTKTKADSKLNNPTDVKVNKEVQVGKGESQDQQRSEIRKLLAEVIDESRFSYDRELLLSLMDQDEGKFQSAINHASRAQTLGSSNQLDAYLASLYERVNKPLVALSIYKRVEQKIVDNEKKDSQNSYIERNNIQQIIENLIGIPFVPSKKTLILRQGRILEEQKKWGEAVVTYSRGIESGIRSNQIRYEYAKSLINTQDPKNEKMAEETLNSIVAPQSEKALETASVSTDAKDVSSLDSSEEFWKKLAQETLDNNKMEWAVKNAAREGK